MRRNTVFLGYISRSAMLVSAFALAGCGAVRNTADAILPDLNGAEFAESAFADTASDGTVARQLAGITEKRVNPAQDVGYAYKGGVNSEGDLVTLAGLNNEDDLARPTFSGTATFSGRARAIFANANTVLERNAFEELTAPFTMRANLSTGEFSGATRDTTNSTMEYTFDGRISNGRLVGTGEFTDGNVEIDTDLRGRISNREAVAVFRGDGRSIAVAGGLYATRR